MSLFVANSYFSWRFDKGKKSLSDQVTKPDTPQASPTIVTQIYGHHFNEVKEEMNAADEKNRSLFNFAHIIVLTCTEA